VTIGALVALLGTFLPWLRSGTKRRSSYEIFSLVDRLGISPYSVIGWGVRIWPIVPMLLAATVTLQWFHRRWLTGAVTLLTVVYAGAVSGALQLAPSASLVAVQHGTIVTLAGSLILPVGAILTWTANRIAS
jgi:hypothetical protein